ncbi:MAG: HDOD domain-containing protein [Tissierellia bacterium]|nr:HDOD domain-containing protein [Tissierellia bacterium]
MDIYVARQPIFDRKMNVLGYELLYRRGMNNLYEGSDDNQATAELISNSYLNMHFSELTDGTKGFINFSEKMLIEQIPLILPKELTVVEILERVEITDELIEACKKISDKGYTIALDDYIFDESSLPLLEIADIVKVEFPFVEHEIQRKLISKYKNRIKFLAEKVETREEYKLALDMGYDYFQGYFFSKPVIIKSKEVDNLNVNLILILEMLNQKEPDFQKMAEVIQSDLGLVYKLLKLANSALLGTRNKIISIKHALVQLGIIEISKWIYVLLLRDVQTVENKELIKTCLIRAKLMELLAIDIGMRNKKLDYFLTGMFSSIDVLTNRDMKEILDELPLSDDVKDALLGKCNEIREMLDMILNYENLRWMEMESKLTDTDISQEKFMNRYIEALTWVTNSDY